MNLEELMLAVHRLLDERDLPHGLGGALALNFYADPRATRDIDVSIFVPWDRHDQVIPHFAALGFEPASDAPATVPGVGIRLSSDDSPFLIDLFFALDEIYDWFRERLVWHPINRAGDELPFLSAEDIVLFKVTFNRAKDWVDISSVVRSGRPLDLDYIEDTLVALKGPTVYRYVARLRALVQAGGDLR